MKTQLLQKINDWLDQILFYPGIDGKTLMRKKIFMMSSAVVLFFVGTLTLACLILGLRILSLYGIFLLVIYSLITVVYGTVRQSLEWLGVLVQVLLILSSFACILLLGGIPYSAGIVFVGLAAVVFSVVFQKVWLAFWFSLLYSSTIIMAGILQPYLTIPDEISHGINILFYVMNGVWISGYILVFVIYFIRQRTKADQAETQRIKDLDELKTKLYTNISHEFRTPLTIILGMTEQIKTDPTKWKKEGLEMIQRSGKQLLRLVNQMLDLSRLEAGAMPVHFIQGDIIAYLRYLIESFQSLAASKQVNLHFSCKLPQVYMDYDADTMAQIVSNLLSNAIKFTPKGGNIIFSVDTHYNNQKGTLLLQIADTGVGIPKNLQPYIFDRFFQVEDESVRKLRGTGMGLALTRELVKLLMGEIGLESTPGKGSDFFVRLPISNNALVIEKIPPSQIQESVSLFLTMPETEFEAIPFGKENQEELPRLLIVEDNSDVVRYLYSLLEKEYNIMVATNGQEGLEKGLEMIPDIILCDVMMPVMDGIELLNRFKMDMRTSHIPIILLTAKADVASRLVGLERGADAYLAKPFIKKELLIRLKKLVELRQKLQERYASPIQPLPCKDKAMQMEDSFMRKVREVMKANLGDEHFHIPQICLAVGMSRAQLYRKFSALTNKSVSEYFRTLRLYKAKELLETTQLNVTEVAFETGFKNLSHFSRIFTEEFGRNPSDLKH